MSLKSETGWMVSWNGHFQILGGSHFHESTFGGILSLGCTSRSEQKGENQQKIVLAYNVFWNCWLHQILWLMPESQVCPSPETALWTPYRAHPQQNLNQIRIDLMGLLYSLEGITHPDCQWQLYKVVWSHSQNLVKK